MLQKKVNEKLAFGVPGDLYDNSPRTIDPYTVAGGAICRYYTVDPADPSKAVLGGEGVGAGLAINSKEYAIYGLEPSMAFRSGVVAQLMTEGRVVMALDVAVNVGDAAFYNKTTGEITAGTAGETKDGFVEIKGSKFVLVNALAGELSVLELNK